MVLIITTLAPPPFFISAHPPFFISAHPPSSLLIQASQKTNLSIASSFLQEPNLPNPPPQKEKKKEEKTQSISLGINPQRPNTIVS